MSSRKYHQKSRNGCGSCKKRRVKCDEGRPSCRNCVRTEMPCIYGTEAARPRGGSGSTTRSSSPRAVPQAIAPASTSTFDLLDLFLMHHFSTSTSVDLFAYDSARIAWQTVVPLEAQSHPLLMHGILAISAVHLACSNPREGVDYRIRALHHQNNALLTYRSALSSVTKDNAHALFGFSMMLAILAFASAHLTEKALNIGEVLERFGLIHGSKIVWRLETDSISTSRMAALLPTTHIGDESKMNIRVAIALDELERFAVDSVLVAAVKQLKVCAGLAFTAPDESPMSARWIAEIDESFWARAKAHEPSALLILAHYAIVLRNYRQTWWLSNWSEVLVASVSDALSDADKEAFGWDQKLEILLHA